MTTQYTITAGSNSTDLGTVGKANTLLGAKRIGRKAVLGLPNGEGRYRVIINGQERGEERSIRTAFKWVAFSS